jgi:hypothetical protein
MKELREYIQEVLLEISSQYSVDTFEQDIKRKWSILDEYARVKRQGLLLEHKGLVLEARLLIEGAWEGIKGFFASAGQKISEKGQWLGKWAGKISGKAFNILKKVAGKLKDMIVMAVKALPGGDTILEFMSSVGSKLESWVQTAKEAIGEKVKPWIESAKEKLISFFEEHVLKDPETRQEFLKAAGIGRGVKESMRHRSFRLLAEADEKDAKAALTGEEQIETNSFRKNFAKVFDKLFDFWLKLVATNPQKYHKPLYESGLFSLFGSTGYGYALGSLIGMLSSGDLNWTTMARYAQAFLKGARAKDATPIGLQRGGADRIGAALFMGETGTKPDASLLRDLIKGIISGSNVEILARVIGSVGLDASAMTELTKRIANLFISGVMKAIKPAISQGLEEEGAGGLDPDLVGEMTQALEVGAGEIFGIEEDLSGQKSGTK